MSSQNYAIKILATEEFMEIRRRRQTVSSQSLLLPHFLMALCACTDLVRYIYKCIGGGTRSPLLSFEEDVSIMIISAFISYLSTHLPSLSSSDLPHVGSALFFCRVARPSLVDHFQFGWRGQKAAMVSNHDTIESGNGRHA